MVVKIRTEKIGLRKPINVHASVSNVDRADEMMIALLSLDATFAEQEEAEDSDDPKAQAAKALDGLKKEREFTRKSLQFLQDVLKLSDKQLNSVKEHIDFDTLGDYLNYVCGRIKGMPESAFKDVKPAPKDQSANSDN